VYNRTQQATSQTLHDAIEEEDGPPALNMVDHFVAFTLAVLLEAGLMPVSCLRIQFSLGAS
jgi:hypothetical protein